MPTSLDASAIATVLTDDFGAARTLPSAAYLTDSVLSWEQRHIFDASWFCVGRTDLVAEPGSQRAISLGGRGVLLVRDELGEVHAFHNTCRHRGHELMPVGECRRKRAIACPYHAWVYGLDGQLVRASRFADIPGFDIADFPLQPMGAEEWNGWIFVNVSGDAEPLSRWLGGLDRHVGDWEPERMVLGAQHEYVVEANWKLILENFVECYHCPSIHPELCRVSDPESGSALPLDGMWLGGAMELHGSAETQSLSGLSTGLPFRRLPTQQLRQVRYFVVFPNLLVSPHPDYLMTHRIEPVTPTSTRVECAWYFPPEAIELPDFDPAFASDFWDRTNQQDFGACESMMRGMHSPGYRPGPFDHREVFVHTVQVMLARAYLEGRLPRPQIAELATA